MMTGMNGSQTTKSTGSSVAVAARCLRSSEGLVVDMEVAVKRMMTGLLAVAVLAAAGFFIARKRKEAEA